VLGQVNASQRAIDRVCARLDFFFAYTPEEDLVLVVAQRLDEADAEQKIERILARLGFRDDRLNLLDRQLLKRRQPGHRCLRHQTHSVGRRERRLV